jgi:phospholipid transport system substrate-binding protein
MRGLFPKKSLSLMALPFVLVAALAVALSARPAQAATPAEAYITESVQRGMAILNNAQLNKEQRKTEFRGFLLGLTDIKAIARYTLGQYRRTATAEDSAAFEETFKEYAMAVYQSYFAKYTGQTLKVTGSYALGSDETIVKTVVVDPKKSSSKPLEVNFRVLNQGGKFVVTDFSVEGVWIRELERNDFTSYLGQNGGNIAVLTASLKKKTALYR